MVHKSIKDLESMKIQQPGNYMEKAVTIINKDAKKLNWPLGRFEFCKAPKIKNYDGSALKSKENI